MLPLGVTVPVIIYIFISEGFNKTLLSFLMDIAIKHNGFEPTLEN